MSAGASVRRVLVTRLRFLGDVVLSTPLLAILREQCPEASLEYLTFDRYAPVLEQHPHVDRVHVVPSGAGLGSMLSLARGLRRPRIDWWVDLFGNPRSALLAVLARPRVSVGPDRGLRARVFDHRRGRLAAGVSAVDHHLDKLRPFLDLEADSAVLAARPVLLRCSDEERAVARERFKLGARGAPLLLHPGSTWPSKAWPERKWGQLVSAMSREFGGPIFVLSAPGEAETSARIARGSGTDAIALPALGLRSLMALLAESRLYVGNDGGILHCAVGLDIPTIGIFGPTEKEIWFPHEQWGPFRLLQEYVPCRPCHRHHCEHLSCLVDLPVHRVMTQARTLLAEEGGVVRHG